MRAAGEAVPVTYSQNLGRTLQLAASIARDQNRSDATAEDLLIALIDDDDAAPVLRALNVDFGRLRRDVLAYMEGATDEAGYTTFTTPRLSAQLKQVLSRAAAHVQNTGRDAVTGADALVEVFREPAGHFLQEQGATRYDAACYLSRGPDAAEFPGAPDTADSPNMEVVLLNDEYTPMAFVVWVLQRLLQVEPAEAKRIMLSTHQTGRGSLGVFGREQALALAARIESLAREHQHPLRSALLPVPDQGPP
jgi:ATP-dependent Clp protease ATP-binding subunit ClpA